MTSELVAGSAWMKPPVDGWAALDSAAVACGEALPPPVCPAAIGLLPRPGWPPVAPRPPPLPLLPPLSAAKAARTTEARRVASAFFRCTTHRPPPGPIRLLGRSSRAMVARSWAMRAALPARTISELLRESATTVTLPPLLGTPGWATALLPSLMRWTSCARSAATACCSGTISTSVPLGRSSAAMILAMRCRLSA